MELKLTRNIGYDGNPTLSAPYAKQLDIIKHIFTPAPNEVKKVDLCCGLGFGKTTLGIDIAQMVMGLGREYNGLFLEPDMNAVNRIFLEEWEKNVPPHLYEINRGKKEIRWIPTGAKCFYDCRWVTGSKDRAADRLGRGPNLAWIIDDESAIQFNRELMQNLQGRLRTNTAIRFLYSSTTPKVGPYARYIGQRDHTVFNGTSYDNPFLPPGYIENLMSEMSDQQVRREIYGEIIALEGRIWSEFDIRNDWPKGNVHPHRFNRSMPFFLFFDIGVATSAWLLVQEVGGVWIAFAEYTPSRDGSIMSVATRIKNDYGIPAKVVAGADLNMRGQGASNTASYYVTKAFGAVPIRTVEGWIADKSIQHERCLFLLKDWRGDRRFCISKHFKSHDEKEHRGIREMADEDQWPDPDKPVASYFPKDGRLEHIRDAFLYGAVGMMAEPRMLPDGRHS